MFPRVTIGITCFNAADTIERAIQSAMDQNWPNLEIIIVDDCSKDSSGEIIKKISENHHNILFLQQKENRGYPAALNSIIQHASGEYIAFFDDDDISTPDRITKQVKRLKEYTAHSNAEIILCYSNRNVIKPNQKTIDHVAKALGRHAPEPKGKAVADFIFKTKRDSFYTWGLFGSCTLMTHRNTFEKVGSFDETFRRSAEWDFAVRAAFLDAHFIAVDEPLITQYKTPTSDKAGNTPLYYALKLREKYRNYLEKENAYWGSRHMARMCHYSARKYPIRSRFFWIIAHLLLPGLFKGWLSSTYSKIFKSKKNSHFK